MIVTKITAGLGNQLFQYAIGRAVADYHQVELKLDTTAYSSNEWHNGFRLNQFAITTDLATDKEIISVRGIAGGDDFFSRAIRKAGVFKKSSYYSEKQRTIFDENVFLLADRYLIGYWQNEQYFIKIRNILLKEFQPVFPLSKQAQEYQQQLVGINSVSLHVRRGDYLNCPEIGVLDLSYYKQAYDYICSKVEKPVIYIFSNDLDWCKQNFDFIDKLVYIEESKTEIDDLMLMSQCKHNIVANSSFSWWGAWLNNNESKIVIAPKKWMAVNPNGYKWALKTWISI